MSPKFKIMITIKVKSDNMEDVRLFKSDRLALSFLKKVKKLHKTVSEHRAGKKPTRKQFRNRIEFIAALDKWSGQLLSTNLQVEIINGSINQTSLQLS